MNEIEILSISVGDEVYTSPAGSWFMLFLTYMLLLGGREAQAGGDNFSTREVMRQMH